MKRKKVSRENGKFLGSSFCQKIYWSIGHLNQTNTFFKYYNMLL